MSKIHFTSHGYKLAGNLFTAEKPKSVAFLFIQGWAGRQNLPTAQLLASKGYTSMTYDMRGNRDSEGNIDKFSRADFIVDAEVAYDYLKSHVGPESKIGVIGGSFGGYTAVMLSGTRDATALSLRAPANYPDEGFNEPQVAQRNKTEDFEAWRLQALDYEENLALTTLHNFDGKVQIIEAGADESVSSQTVKNYVDSVADKTKLTYSLMEGAPHRLENEQLQAEYDELVVRWAASL